MKRQLQAVSYVLISLLMLSIVGAASLWKVSAMKQTEEKKEQEVSQTAQEQLIEEEKADKEIIKAELSDKDNFMEESGNITEDVREYVVQTPYDKKIFLENGIEFHFIAGDTWQGVMQVIPDASRVFIGTPRDTYTGAAGMTVQAIVNRYANVVSAVNGAFFVDVDQVGNGGTPIGFVFSQGEQKYGGNGPYRVIGLNHENKAVCGTMTAKEALEAGIRDGLTCNPILVQQGEIGDLTTMNQTLRDARTAIGSRADGCFLILTIDGRMAHSIGATTRDEAEVMLAFGAVAAGNLDGGGSVGLYYAGTPLEGISSILGLRPIPNAVCVLGE